MGCFNPQSIKGLCQELGETILGLWSWVSCGTNRWVYQNKLSFPTGLEPFNKSVLSTLAWLALVYDLTIKPSDC
jgi:hypothetical protein